MHGGIYALKAQERRAGLQLIIDSGQRPLVVVPSALSLFPWSLQLVQALSNNITTNRFPCDDASASYHSIPFLHAVD